MSCHRKLLEQYREHLHELYDINHNLSCHVAVLEEEVHVHDTYIDELNHSINELCTTINSMVDHLCHCSEGKGKEREVVVKMEEESEGLEYASDDEYKTVPGTSKVVVRELIPIERDLESREVMQEAKESCGCSLEDYPIFISEDKVTIAENAIPIQMQVECPMPEDHIMSDQCAVHSSGPIHSSHLFHIAGIPVNIHSNYIVAKAIEHKHQGEELVKREGEVSLGFSNKNSNNDSSSGVSSSS